MFDWNGAKKERFRFKIDGDNISEVGTRIAYAVQLYYLNDGVEDDSEYATTVLITIKMDIVEGIKAAKPKGYQDDLDRIITTRVGEVIKARIKAAARPAVTIQEKIKFMTGTMKPVFKNK